MPAPWCAARIEGRWFGDGAGALRDVRDLSRLRLGEARRLEAREWREGAGCGELWLAGVLEGFVGWRGGVGRVRLPDFLSLGVLAMIRGGYAEDGTRVGGTNFVIGFEFFGGWQNFTGAEDGDLRSSVSGDGRLRA